MKIKVNRNSKQTLRQLRHLYWMLLTKCTMKNTKQLYQTSVKCQGKKII